jgi:hypothetical protein
MRRTSAPFAAIAGAALAAMTLAAPVAAAPVAARAPGAQVRSAPAGPSSASVALPARTLPRYLVCVPAVDVPRPNYRYPFRFLLSTAYRRSHNTAIRTAVRSIQEVVNAENYPGPGSHLLVDGSYGPRTRAAVIIYQRHHHLVVDGKVGSQTWRSLASNCWKYH